MSVEPRNDGGASLRDRAASLRPQPASQSSRSGIPSAGLQDAFRPMDEWDERDEPVLLLVDYRDGGAHPLEDCGIGLTIGHNNDHNTPGEGKGWQFAGWCWSHDHYTEGRGTPIAWKPLTEYLFGGR